MKARDPAGDARALPAAMQARSLSGAALAQAIARQDLEARGRVLSWLTQALHEVNAAKAAQSKRRRRADNNDKALKRRRPYRWRPMVMM